MDKTKTKTTVFLGVDNKRVSKKQHRKKKSKRLLDKVVDYLKSDSYMFAPKLSDFSTTNAISASSSSFTGDEKVELNEEENKNLLRKVGEYLRSDYYMYAPLVDLHLSDVSDSSRVSPPNSATVPHLKETKAAAVSKGTNLPTKSIAKARGKDHPCDKDPIRKSTVFRQTIAHRETVKHVIQHDCRYSSIPEKETLETGQRKSFVE